MTSTIHDHEQIVEAMRDRLSALERRSRRLMLVVAAASIGAMSAGLIGWTSQPASQRELTTQRLVINGPDGQPRAMLTGTGDGSSFFLYGPDKYKSVAVGGADSEGGEERGGGGPPGGVGGMVAITPRMRFMCTAEGTTVQMLDPDGTERLILSLTADGPKVQMLDVEGNELTEE